MVCKSRENKQIIQAAAALPFVNGLKEEIWKLKAPLKIRTFLWKAISSAIPVVDLIMARGIRIDDRCQTCGLTGESVNHVIFICTVARQIWAMSGVPSPAGGHDPDSLFTNVSYLLSVTRKFSYL